MSRDNELVTTLHEYDVKRKARVKKIMLEAMHFASENAPFDLKGDVIKAYIQASAAFDIDDTLIEVVNRLHIGE